MSAYEEGLPPRESASGGLPRWGGGGGRGCSASRRVGQIPPRTRKAGGTHPTGKLSCLMVLLFCSSVLGHLSSSSPLRKFCCLKQVATFMG